MSKVVLTHLGPNSGLLRVEGPQPLLGRHDGLQLLRPIPLTMGAMQRFVAAFLAELSSEY